MRGSLTVTYGLLFFSYRAMFLRLQFYLIIFLSVHSISFILFFFPLHYCYSLDLMGSMLPLLCG